MPDPVNLHGEPVPFDQRRADFLRTIAENYDELIANGDPPESMVWCFLDRDGIGGAGWNGNFTHLPARAMIVTSIGMLHLALSRPLSARGKAAEYELPPPPDVEDDPDGAA
jgi:hypothetical protein